MLVHPNIRRKVAVLYISFVSFFFYDPKLQFYPMTISVLRDLRFEGQQSYRKWPSSLIIKLFTIHFNCIITVGLSNLGIIST